MLMLFIINKYKNELLIGKYFLDVISEKTNS